MNIVPLNIIELTDKTAIWFIKAARKRVRSVAGSEQSVPGFTEKIWIENLWVNIPPSP